MAHAKRIVFSLLRFAFEPPIPASTQEGIEGRRPPGGSWLRVGHPAPFLTCSACAGKPLRGRDRDRDPTPTPRALGFTRFQPPAPAASGRSLPTSRPPFPPSPRAPSRPLVGVPASAIGAPRPPKPPGEGRGSERARAGTTFPRSARAAARRASGIASPPQLGTEGPLRGTGRAGTREVRGGPGRRGPAACGGRVRGGGSGRPPVRTVRSGPVRAPALPPPAGPGSRRGAGAVAVVTGAPGRRHAGRRRCALASRGGGGVPGERLFPRGRPPGVPSRRRRLSLGRSCVPAAGAAGEACVVPADGRGGRCGKGPSAVVPVR